MIPDSPSLDSDDTISSRNSLEEFSLSDSESDNDQSISTISSNNKSMLNVSIDDFQCSICLELMVEPISLLCGHSYCRTCLVECAQKGSNRKCPSCRAPINQSINLLEAPQCVLLARIIQSAFPTHYEKRQTINRSIKESWKYRFPVCFVDAVLFPNQSMLIHLYEPRYKTMCERLINQSTSGKRFALFSTRFQASVDRAVGLLVEATEITRSSNDSYLLYITAVERCAVVDCWEEPETQSLFQSQVALIQDDEITNQADNEFIQSTVTSIHSSIEQFDRLSKLTGSGRSFVLEFGSVPSHASELSFWLFSCLLNDQSARGASVEHDNVLIPELLASKSVLWRLQRGSDMLNEALQQLRHREPLPPSRALQPSAAEYVPMGQQQSISRPCPPYSLYTQPRSIHPRQGQRMSMRPSRAYHRNARPAWPSASPDQPFHSQHRVQPRSFDEQ